MVGTMSLSVAADPAPIRVNAAGVAVVGGTRVPLDTVVSYYEGGASPETIVERFPTLALGDVYAAIAYYLRHKEQVAAYLAERRRVAEGLRAEAERRFPPKELKERLQRRRAAG
jgi:uncharacterized protein (DUF433 family)